MTKVSKAEKIGYWITCLPESIGWYARMEYTGHSLTKKSDGWLLIVRAKRSQRAMVSFYHAQTIWDCFWRLGSDLTLNQVKWREDLYQSTVSKA
jgi:hypothetical protein